MFLQIRCIFMEDTQVCKAWTKENDYSFFFPHNFYYKYAELDTEQISGCSHEAIFRPGPQDYV